MPIPRTRAVHQRLSPDRLAVLSQRMAGVTLFFMVAMLVLNAASWFEPAALVRKHGFSFGLSARFADALDVGVDVRGLTWWQTLGAIVISSVPLLILMSGLLHLRDLFRVFAQGAYFSANAAFHLGKVGRAVAWWVLVEFLCEPFLSVWLTMLRGQGNRVLTLSFDTHAIVALFVAASIAVIARILARAGELYEENKQFV